VHVFAGRGVCDFLLYVRDDFAALRCASDASAASESFANDLANCAAGDSGWALLLSDVHFSDATLSGNSAANPAGGPADKGCQDIAAAETSCFWRTRDAGGIGCEREAHAGR